MNKFTNFVEMASSIASHMASDAIKHTDVESIFSDEERNELALKYSKVMAIVTLTGTAPPQTSQEDFSTLEEMFADASNDFFKYIIELIKKGK